MDVLYGENRRRHSRPPARQRVNNSGLKVPKNHRRKAQIWRKRQRRRRQGALQWKISATVESLEIHCQRPGAKESYKVNGKDTYYKLEPWPTARAAGTRIPFLLGCTVRHRSCRRGSCVGGSHVIIISKATRCSSSFARCFTQHNLEQLWSRYISEPVQLDSKAPPFTQRFRWLNHFWQ